MQVTRKPGQIQPRSVVDATESEHHSPHCAVTEQAAPFGKTERISAGIDATCIEISLFNGSQFYVLAVAIEHIPANGEKNPQHTNGNKHPTPAHHQHHRRQNRWAYGNANGRSCVEEAHRASALFDVEPVVNDFYATWVHRRFTNPHTDTHQHELRKAVHHARHGLEQ